MCSRSQISKNCANWNNGKCLGALLKAEYNIKKGTAIIKTVVDKTMVDKNCKLIENKPCQYWDNFVVPNLNGKE